MRARMVGGSRVSLSGRARDSVRPSEQNLWLLALVFYSQRGAGCPSHSSLHHANTAPAKENGPSSYWPVSSVHPLSSLPSLLSPEITMDSPSRSTKSTKALTLRVIALSRRGGAFGNSGCGTSPARMATQRLLIASVAPTIANSRLSLNHPKLFE